METKLTTVSTDLKALGTADLLASLTGSGSLDADKIASFMESPTVIDTKNVYPVNSYGSGMAPLMTNLALWVGAFAFVVIYKVEVDDEGLRVSIRPQPKSIWPDTCCSARWASFKARSAPLAI